MLRTLFEKGKSLSTPWKKNTKSLSGFFFFYLIFFVYVYHNSEILYVSLQSDCLGQNIRPVFPYTLTGLQSIAKWKNKVSWNRHKDTRIFLSVLLLSLAAHSALGYLAHHCLLRRKPSSNTSLSLTLPWIIFLYYFDFVYISIYQNDRFAFYLNVYLFYQYVNSYRE